MCSKPMGLQLSSSYRSPQPLWRLGPITASALQKPQICPIDGDIRHVSGCKRSPRGSGPDLFQTRFECHGRRAAASHPAHGRRAARVRPGRQRSFPLPSVNGEPFRARERRSRQPIRPSSYRKPGLPPPPRHRALRLRSNRQ